MREGSLNRSALMGRIVDLVGSGGLTQTAANERLAGLDDAALSEMLNQLEAAGATADAVRTTRAEDVKRREEIEANRSAALLRLERTFDRIKDRRKASVDDSAPADALAKLIDDRHPTKSLAPSIELIAAVKATQQNLLQNAELTDFKSVDLLHELVGHLDLPSSPLEDLSTSTKRLVVEAYLQHAALKCSFDILRLLDKDFEDSKRGFGRIHPAVKMTMRTSAFDMTFIPDRNPHLGPAAAAESLAKLSLFAFDFKPTHIVAMGPGGHIVGQFLAQGLSRARSSSPEYAHLAKWHPRHISSEWAEGPSSPSILIVTDLVATAGPFDEIRSLFENAGQTNLAIVGLGAHTDAYEQLATSGTTYFTHLVADHDLTFPWHRAGTYHRTRTRHVFGHDGSRPFEIARNFMDEVAASLQKVIGIPFP